MRDFGFQKQPGASLVAQLEAPACQGHSLADAQESQVARPRQGRQIGRIGKATPVVADGDT